MLKGITPIISIIVLLLITVALAGTAWTFLIGFITPQISKTFIIPTGGSYCSNGFIIIYVTNTGYQSNITPKIDFNLAQIDGNDASGNLSTATISTGESGKILHYDCDGVKSNGGSCSKGYHTVDLGTISSIQHPSVYCP